MHPEIAQAHAAADIERAWLSFFMKTGVAGNEANRSLVAQWCQGDIEGAVTPDSLSRAAQDSRLVASLAKAPVRTAASVAPAVVPVEQTPVVVPAPKLTKADVRKMTGAEFQQAMRERPDELEALGYKVVKGSYYEMRMRAGKK